MQPQATRLPGDDIPSEYIQILNGLGQAILVIDSGGRIMLVNRQAEKTFGWNGEKLRGHELKEVFLTPGFMEELNKNVRRLQHGESWRGDCLVKKGDGSSIPANISIGLIPGAGQDWISLTCAPRDFIENQQLKGANRLLAKIDDMLVNWEDRGVELTELAQLFVPAMADRCAIFMRQVDESAEPVVVAPAEMASDQAFYDWLHNDLPNDDVDGLPEVFQRGESKLVIEVSPVRRASEAGIKAYMIVPLATSRGILGAIALIAIEPGRYYDQSQLAIAENIALHLSIFIEKSRLHNASQKFNVELEQLIDARTAELQEAVAQLKQSDELLQTLFRVSNKLNATLDMDLILDELAQEAIKMVDGESGFAGLRTPEGMTVHKYYQGGEVIPFEHTWAIGEGIPGWVLKYKVPYGTSDAVNDPLIRHELEINANIRSVICTPILDTTGEVIGYFDIRNKRGGEGFTINDQEMLLTLAPVASIAIQNALTYQQRITALAELKSSANQLQELAASLESTREEERTQIARELHDQLGQSLTAMKFDLAWLTEQLEKKDNELAQKAKDIIAQMNTMIKTVRRITTDLRPGMLDDLGLVASIEWQAHDFEKRTGIECSIEANIGEVNLGRDQKLTMFRIFQEALTNIARYADAKHVKVSLSITGEVLSLEIHDDGRGIKADEIASAHSLGLISMRERAKYLGGIFSIQGAPDQGTTLKVSLPINIRAAQE